MVFNFENKITSSKFYKDFKSSIWFDILGLRQNRREIFERNWNEAGFKKKLIIFSFLFLYRIILYLLILAIGLIAPSLLRREEIPFRFLFELSKLAIAVAICSAILFINYIRVSQVTAMDNFFKNSLFPVLYISFVFYSSLCFIRLGFSLPAILTQPQNSKFMDTEYYDNDLEFANEFLEYTHLSFLYSYSMKVVIAFLIFRLFLNLLNGIPAIELSIERAKLIWKYTVTTWGVMFTVLTTISIIWVAAVGK